MNTTFLSGELFANMIRCGAQSLYEKRETVNGLNVFPIPDGDTGDNMYMTIDSGCLAIQENETSLDGVSSSVANGMLMGARGNSGVILSRFFAGVAKALSNTKTASVAEFADALLFGVSEAYSAVSNPTEGTILTVFRESSQYARERIIPEYTFEDFFSDYLSEIEASLKRTPSLLSVLEEAGVVDSGGAGFMYIARGMRDALDGKTAEATDRGVGARAVDLSLFSEDSVLLYGYCTELLIRLQRSKVDLDAFDESVISDYLNSVGDSVVFFREGSVIKLHVHTENPGDVLNFCRRYGEFLTVKIENMTLQHSETEENKAQKEESSILTTGKKKPYGIVVVAAGEGIKENLREVGADVIVDGGQSMNPSTKDFIDAYGKCGAEVIFVFPSNRNVILAAEQSASVYKESKVIVVPTKTVGESYAALPMLDFSLDDPEEIKKGALEAAAGVVSGFISRSVRDAHINCVDIAMGEYIGVADKEILVGSPEREKALLSLTEKLSAGDYDIMLIFCGMDVPEDEAEKVYREISEKYRRTEVIMIDGGQPIYDYMITLE